MLASLKKRYSELDTQDKTFFIRLFALAFIVNILTAIQSVGFHHPDEHFQTIELMNYKLGHVSASDLVWEFHEKIRPWLQPTFYFITYRIVHFFCSVTPFTFATILRVEGSILTTLAQGLFLLSLYRVKKDRFSWRLSCFFVFLFWLFPYLSGRTSSESFSNLCLLFSLAYFFFSLPNQSAFSLSRLFQKIEISPQRFFVLGCLLGLTFEFRFQSAFFIFGFCSWILLNTKNKPIFVLTVCGGFLSVVLLSLFIDRWGYGVFCFPPYQYFKINILDGVAAQFGVMPWYDYLHEFIHYCGYVFGSLLVCFYITSFFQSPYHLFHWLVLPFVLMHFSIDHKEIRFLFPVLNIAIIPISELLSELKITRHAVIRFILAALLLWNTWLILSNLINPLHKRDINILRFLQTHTPSTVSYCPYIESQPYAVVNSNTFYLDIHTSASLHLNFYKNDKIKGIFPIRNPSQPAQIEWSNDLLTCLIVQEPELLEPILKQTLFEQCKLTYIDAVIPNWIFKHWPRIFSTLWTYNNLPAVFDCSKSVSFTRQN